MKEILISIALFFTSLIGNRGEVLKEVEINKDENTVILKDITEKVFAEELKFVKNTSPVINVTTNPLSTSGWWKYPETINQTTRNGNDLLVLVNKSYKLPNSYAPSDLVKASNSGIRRGENYYVRNILISDLKILVSDAKNDGIDLSIVSAYRSYQTQVSTYNYWVQYNGGSVDAADKISARAGHSQHQLGTAIDFSSNEVSDQLGITFSKTKASKWLSINAWKYGFVLSFPSGYESVTGYSYESWHYRYIGKSNALEMKNSGMILENYLKSKN